MTRTAFPLRSSFRLLMSVGVSVMLAGCAGGFLSGSGPRIGAIVEAPENRTIPYHLVDLSPATIAPYARMRDQSVATTVSAPKSFEVRLIPGDVIQVMVADIGGDSAVFAPLAAGGTKFEARVDSVGKISLPYAGRFVVAGKTPVGVEEEIRRRLKGVASDPQVMVSLLGDVSGSVLVAGAVKQPGRFSALQGPLTLLDAINLAGGPLLEPHLVSVTVRDGKEAHVYSYQSLLDGLNRPVSPRSEIIVSRAKKRFVAMGAVKAPGLHDLPSDQPSLLEVLGQAGWLEDSTADPQGVFVFRLARMPGSEQAIPEVFRLNTRDPAAVFLAKEFRVQAEDAVYVTNAAVYEWQKIINPIAQAMAIGRTLQSGF